MFSILQQRVEAHIPYGKMLLQKNFTSAELMLRRPSQSTDRTYDVTISTARRHNKLISRSFVESRKQFSLAEQRHDVAATDVMSNSKHNKNVLYTQHLLKCHPTAGIHLREPQQHVDVGVLCKHLQSRGLGDPRKLLQSDRKNRRDDARQAASLLRKRTRQERKFDFYLEKLRGCAKIENDVVNSRAEAFIAQFIPENMRRERNKFRFVTFGDERQAGEGLSERCSSDGDVTRTRHDDVDRSVKFKSICDWIQSVNDAKNT